MSAAPQIDVHASSVELNMAPALLSFSSNRRATATNAAAAVTLDADASVPNVLRQIFASYTATPTAPAFVTVEDGSGTVVWKQYISAGGEHTWTFDPPLCGSANTAMIVTLSAGGSAIVGELYVNGYKHK